MNRIKELRTGKGLTLKDFASSFNEFTKKDRDHIKSVSYATVSRWEKGINEPKLDTWLKLADFFGVSIGYIQGTSEIRESFYNEDDPFNSWANAMADKILHDEGFKPYVGESMKHFLEEGNVREFVYLCSSLNTSALFTREQIKENAKMISNISSIDAASAISSSLSDFFYLSLKAYNGDEEAKKDIINIRKIIYKDYN